jgi:hypothetical protein
MLCEMCGRSEVSIPVNLEGEYVYLCSQCTTTKPDILAYIWYLKMEFELSHYKAPTTISLSRELTQRLQHELPLYGVSLQWEPCKILGLMIVPANDGASFHIT